jgi:hypothetical protein
MRNPIHHIPLFVAAWFCIGFNPLAFAMPIPAPDVALEQSTDDDRSVSECGTDECSEAMKKLVRFSLNGSPDAQVIVAMAYATGDGVPMDHTLARQHLKRALRNQDERAWHMYSRWLRDGLAFEQDLDGADEALDRAARQQYAPALFERAVRNFSETAADNSRAVADLERAAEQLHKPSMYLLAQIKAAGLGVAADVEQASQLYAFLARSSYRESAERLQLLVGSVGLQQQTEQLSLAFVEALAERHRSSDVQAMEVITVSSSTIGTEDFVIDLVEQLDKLRTFDGRSTGSRIRGQVCGRGVAQCRVIYNAAAGTISMGGTVRDAVEGIGW